MFSYDEDDMVEDPNLAQHLAHFGINITQMEKVTVTVLKMQSCYGQSTHKNAAPSIY